MDDFEQAKTQCWQDPSSGLEHVSSSRRSWTLTLYWMDIASLRRQLSRVLLLGSTLTLSWHLRRIRNKWPRDVSTNFASCGRSGTRCQLTVLECWSTHLSLLKSTTVTASYIKLPPSTYDHSSLRWTPQHDWLPESRSRLRPHHSDSSWWPTLAAGPPTNRV